MAVLGTHYIDSYNYLQCGYDITGHDNTTTTFVRWIRLVVQGHVSWSSGVIDFYSPTNRTALSYEVGSQGTWYGGTYTLAQEMTSVTQQPGQELIMGFRGKINTSYSAVNWEFEYSFQLPATDAPTQITSVSGDKLKGDISATFTASSAYNYRLRVVLSKNNSPMQTFSPYTSGQAVRLSEQSLAYINTYDKSSQVKLKLYLETYKGARKIGETYKVLTLSNTKGLHIRINGVWKDAIPYVRINGQWKESIPYARVNNQWKEGI